MPALAEQPTSFFDHLASLTMDELRAKKDRLKPIAEQHIRLGEDAPKAVRAGAAMYEATLRHIRGRQADLGEAGDSETHPRPGGLLEFVRYFWHVLEPTTPFIDGWVVEAICMHLEAVTRGEINRIVINVSPGFCKSMIVNVFFPAWEWSAAGMPSMRYVTFSYGAHLTLRDNQKFRDLLISPEFTEIWGSTVKLKKAGEIKPENEATGWKFASSVGGVGTGERGNRVLCLPGSEPILTSWGWLPIRDVVEGRLPVKIAGLNHETNAIEWQDIEAYERNPGNEIVEVACASSTLRCTRDHPVFVQGSGYARADSLKGGEQLVWTGGDDAVPSVRNGDLAQAKPSASVLQQSVSDNGRASLIAAYKQPPVHDVRDADLSSAFASQTYAGETVLQSQMPRSMEPWCQQSRLHGPSSCGMRVVRSTLSSSCEETEALLFEVLGSRTARTHQRSLESESNVPRVLGTISCNHQESKVLHPGLRQQGPFTSHKRERQWSLRSRTGQREIPAWLDENAQSPDQSARRQLLPAVRSPTRDATSAGCSSYRLRQDEPRPSQSDNALPVLPRQDARELGASATLVSRPVRSVTVLGHEAVTYNVRVGPHHNYFANGFLVHNCDDLHSVRYAESDAVRGETVRWVREGMSNRLNDMRVDVIIGIGQRVHELDASAAMLEDEDYVHLFIPMEFMENRRCATKIGWVDPRTQDGELAWPERFPQSVVNKLKTTLGPYAWGAQYQQVPSPRGGGIIKSDWWQLWNEPAYPACYYKWASADTAYTEKEENDPTGFTAWGLFDIGGQPNVILLDAWRKRLELHIPVRWVDDKVSPDARLRNVQLWQKAAHAEYRASQANNQPVQEPLIDPTVEPWATYIRTGQNESQRWPAETYTVWKLRTQHEWGLCEWLAHSCNRFKVHELIIEGKASGLSVAQELRRLNGNDGWGIKTVTPEGDKGARLYSVQATFSAGLVHAPDREWSQMVIDEVSSYPKGRYRDLTDSTSMAMKHVRELGLLLRPEERQLAADLSAQYRPQSKPLYPGAR